MIRARLETLRIAALGLLAVSAWMVLRVAVDQQFSAAQPERIEWALPLSGNALLALAAKDMVANGGIADAITRGRIADAMVRIPVAGQPLALAGLAASGDGDLGKATQLMEAARQRSSRVAFARNWLLNVYVSEGRYPEALTEAAVLMRLAPASREQIYALIAAMAARPDAAPAVQHALDARPDWAQPYAIWRASHGRSTPAQ